LTAAGPRSVVVVGGGVIGLLCAHYLRRGGADVTVVERDRLGRGCSWGNLGWVCPSISVPLPAPGLDLRSMTGMLERDSPLYIRASALPRLGKWLLSFRAHCNETDFAAGSTALRGLNEPTGALFDELAADGIEFEYAKAGLTFVSTEAKALRHEKDMIEDVGAARVEEWNAEELASREPDLPATFTGALHVSTDRHVRADSLCTGVSAALVASGGRVLEGFDVRRLRHEGDRLVAVEGPDDSIEADAFVLAVGAETGMLASSLGTRLPLQAGKGYSLSIRDPRVRLNSPLYLCDQKVGLTPYEGMLRVGGTMELSGINDRLDRGRIESIRRVVSPVIPDAFEGSEVVEWVGMRPLTPDGLPVIGAIPGVRNAFVATGHQMLGVTLAPSTGHALAGLMLEGRSDVDLSPFSPDRFAVGRR